jgi:hypothetical protein
VAAAEIMWGKEPLDYEPAVDKANQGHV